MASLPEEEQDKSLICHLVESLNSIMSPDANVRNEAEQRLKLLEVTEDFGVHLAKITVDLTCDLALRQLSSLILKQYVETHWCSIAEKFCPPQTTDFAKSAIRQMLPLGLRDSHSKVRTSVAYAISTIAGWDWPEEWPGLFECLMQALTDGDANCVHGTMRVLTEFVRDITDVHMVKVAPVLLPHMLRIFTQADHFNVRIRSRAVTIFSTCALFVDSMAGAAKDTLKMILVPYLPKFLQAFGEALKVPDGDVSDPGLKKEVLKTIRTLLRSFPRDLKGAMTVILPVIWTTLTNGAEIYVRTEVTSLDEDEDKTVDSDGEVIGFQSLIFSVFDMIETLLDMRKFRFTIKKSLEDLIYYLIMYMQITHDQARSWSEDPDQFVEDEDDDTFSYSVRISAMDLFLSCCREFKQASAVGLFKAIERHILQANSAREAKHPYWWKTYESTMLAIGSVQPLIVESIQNQVAPFDLNIFLTSVVLPSMKVADAPFLVGRALWLASRFTQQIEPAMLNQLIETTVHGLQENQPPAVRISAVRAVFNYCDHLKQTNSTQLLAPFITSLLDGLLQLATQARIETLALVLETLRIVLTIDDATTALYESRVTPLALAVFLKHSNDPLIISLASDIFEVLAAKENCNKSLMERLIPTFHSIFTAPPEKISSNLVSTTLELLCTVVRNSKAPLHESLITKVFPAAVKCTVESDDNSIIQNGGDCARAFLSISSSQISIWQDEEGTSGLHYILRVVSHILDPKLSEYSATFVGRLVSVLIRECGKQLNEVLDQLLRAVLSKLQQAKTLSVTQSLLVIFANLFNNELVPTLVFLCNVPGPSGNTALDFIMTEWCEKQHLFYGSYDSKLCVVALSKLFQHGVTTEDERLANIQVKGDQIFSESSVIRTRSKARQEPEKWTVVTLPVKMLKIMISELSTTSEPCEAHSIEDDEDGNYDTGLKIFYCILQCLLLPQMFYSNLVSGKSSKIFVFVLVPDDDDMYLYVFYFFIVNYHVYEFWYYSDDEWVDDDDDDDNPHNGEVGAGDASSQTLEELLDSVHPGFGHEDYDDQDDEDPDALADPINELNLREYLTGFLTEFCGSPVYSQYFSAQLNHVEKKVLAGIGISNV